MFSSCLWSLLPCLWWLRHIPEAAAGCPCPWAGVQGRSFPLQGFQLKPWLSVLQGKLILGMLQLPVQGSCWQCCCPFPKVQSFSCCT